MNSQIITGLIVVCLLGVVSQQATAGDPIRGRSIYTQHCAGCHGANGRGVIAGTPSFVAGSTTLMKPDQDLRIVIENGRGVMPAFRGTLKADQIDDVISHLRTFF